MSKIIVHRVHSYGDYSDFITNSWENACEHVRLEHGAHIEAGQRVAIFTEEMDEAEFNALPEWEP